MRVGSYTRQSGRLQTQPRAAGGRLRACGDRVECERRRQVAVRINLCKQVLRLLFDPGKVFDLELPLAQAAQGYDAMDQRRAIKVLLRP